MEFLRFLESIRVPVLNEFMLAITHLGETTAFLVIALILFWCVDKKQGYLALAVGFVGTIITQCMKLIFRIPRPWVLDDRFTVLEQAKEAAGGYSFPSGHTQTSVGIFGTIAATTKDKKIRMIAVFIAVLVPFSRMYIGVHTVLDVIVSAVIAIALVIVFKPIVYKDNGKYIPLLLGGITILAVLYLCYVELFPFPEDIDLNNYKSGLKNAYTLLGAMLGILVVYFVDHKWIRFPVKAIWWAQLLKVCIGLVLVLAVKNGMKDLLDTAFGEMIGRAIRYFMIVVVAGALWPLSFRWFAKLGKNK